MNFVKKIIVLITSGNQRSVAVKKNIIGSFALKGISIVISFLLVPLKQVDWSSCKSRL